MRKRGLYAVEVVARGARRTTELALLDAVSLSFAQRLGPGNLAARLVVAALRHRGLAAKVGRFVFPRVFVAAWLAQDPPAAWASTPQAPDLGDSVVISSSPGSERAYVYRFDPRHVVPALVAKVGLLEGGFARVAREADALRDVAHGAGRDRVEVPTLLHRASIGAAPVLLESFVAGQAAARVLAGRPDVLDRLLADVAAWLTSWGILTVRRGMVPPDLVDAVLLGPSRLLANVLPPEFKRTVEAHAASFREPATAAAHNDLSMWNIVVRSGGEIGILDWESATQTALPLCDLYYALVDGVAAVDRYKDRHSAFRACFSFSGSRAGWARELVAAYSDALSLDYGCIAAAFAATWLHHARSERELGRDAEFVSLLVDLAAAPDQFWPMAAGEG